MHVCEVLVEVLIVFLSLSLSLSLSHTHSHSHTQLRRIFSDFSMFVAILTMVIIAYILRDKIAVETLVVPANFQPSCPSRSDLSWIINPFTSDRMEIWMYFAALIPASLVRMNRG